MLKCTAKITKNYLFYVLYKSIQEKAIPIFRHRIVKLLYCLFCLNYNMKEMKEMGEMKEEILKEYNQLRKKYKLPEFKDLDDEFEISRVRSINQKFLLRVIRRKILDKIVFFCRILEMVIYPSSNSVIAMQEAGNFPEEDKPKVIELIKKLMYLERDCVRIDISPSTEKDAEFIKNVFREWEPLKKQMTGYTEKIRDGWKKEEEKKKLSY